MEKYFKLEFFKTASFFKDIFSGNQKVKVKMPNGKIKTMTSSELAEKAYRKVHGRKPN